jgi:hypothetical protein
MENLPCSRCERLGWNCPCIPLCVSCAASESFICCCKKISKEDPKQNIEINIEPKIDKSSFCETDDQEIEMLKRMIISQSQSIEMRDKIIRTQAKQLEIREHIEEFYKESIDKINTNHTLELDRLYNSLNEMKYDEPKEKPISRKPSVKDIIAKEQEIKQSVKRDKKKVSSKIPLTNFKKK